MRIVEGSQIEANAWADLVKHSSVATWFQTQEAYSFFNGLMFLEVFAYAVEVDHKLKGVIVGYIQKDGGKMKRFFSCRAIIIGGPLLSDDISKEELTTLLMVMKANLRKKVIYIETRNLHDYSKWMDIFETCRFNYKPHLNFLVKCQPKEMLWSNLKENRRRQIKKSLKEGVRVEEASCETEIRYFYGLLSDLYRTKVKTPLFPIDFFLEFFRKGYGKYFLVKFNDEIIGGIMCPILNNKTIYELFVCGKDVLCKNKYPSVMATWAAMEYAANNDIAMFDFMGAGKPDEEYGVREFKSKFGGELVEYGRYCNVCKPILFAVGKSAVRLMKRI